MKKTRLVLATLTVSLMNFAQPLPLEIMTGNKNYYQQFSYSKVLYKSHLGFFNTSSLLFMYKEGGKSELMSQSYITFRIMEDLKLGTGVFYASVPGLNPSFNLAYSKSFKSLSVIVSPRMDIKRSPSYDLMSALELRHTFQNNFKGFLRIQTMFNYTGVKHNRSYQYLRIGIGEKDKQFGFAVNLDYYGTNYKRNINIGIFSKIIL